jgi:hypothetical protein
VGGSEEGIGDSVVNFVCDITVVEAGKSDQYILKPQIAQSEVGQKFKEMKQAGKPVKLGEDEEEELEIELEEDEEQPEEFEGTITAISENEENASPWTMTLEGVEGQVTVYVTKLKGRQQLAPRRKSEEE